MDTPAISKLREQAQQLLDQGQIAKALQELHKILELQPEDTRTLTKIGDLKLKQKDIKGASALYEQAATLQIKEGFLLKAITLYKQILTLEPQNIRIHRQLATSYQQLGLIKEAIAQYKLLYHLYETDKQPETELLNILKKILELDSQDLQALLKLAESYLRLGEKEMSFAYFGAALKTLKQAADLDNYLKVGERILYLNPKDYALTEELATIYLQKNEPQKALNKLYLCLQKNPRNLKTLMNLAKTFLALGKRPKSLKVYLEILEILKATPNQDLLQEVLEELLKIDPQNTVGLQLAEELASAAKTQITPTSALTSPDAQEIDIDIDIPEEITLDFADLLTTTDNLENSTELNLVTPSLATPATPKNPQDIAGLLLEAEIFVKYQLNDKALANLQKIFKLQPQHQAARELWSKIAPTQPILVETTVPQTHPIPIVSPAPLLQELSVEAPPESALAASAPVKQGSLPPLAPPSVPLELPSVKDQPALTLTRKEPTLLTTPLEIPLTAEEDELENDLNEIQFYADQGLKEEATAHCEALLKQYPTHPALLALRVQLTSHPLEDQLQEAEEELPAREPPRQTPETVTTTRLPPQQISPLPIFPNSRTPEELPRSNVSQKASELLEIPLIPAQEPRNPPASLNHLPLLSAEEHYNLGLAYKEVGAYREALQELAIAVNDRTYKIRALILTAICERYLGDKEAAKQTLLSALALKEATAHEILCLNYELAATYELQNNYAQALHFYEKTYALDRHFRNVRQKVIFTQEMCQEGLRENFADVTDLDVQLDNLLREVKDETNNELQAKPAPKLLQTL